MMEDIEFHFIELKKLKTSIAELHDPLESWSIFIRNSETLSEEEMQELVAKNPALKKARKTLEEISQDSGARLAYDCRKSTIFFYEKTLEKKFEDGKQEGMLVGKQEGKQEGKLEDAQKMLKKKYPLPDILEITGLTIDDLKQAGLVENQ